VTSSEKTETIYAVAGHGVYTGVDKGSFATIEERLRHYGGEGAKKQPSEVLGYSFQIIQADPSANPGKDAESGYRVWVSATKL
jgi:hypothetical protein